MLKYLFFILSFLISINVFAAQEPDHAIHEELRALLQDMEKAVNEERYDDLAPFFHKNLRITTINQEIISSREEIGQYFNRWFGAGGFLKKVDMELKADTKTDLYGNKTVGVVWGSGDEFYVLSDARKYHMKTRWTATVIKDTDGKWRILTLHIGTNFLDNPILDKAEGGLIYFAIGGLISGIILMFVINIFLKRLRKT